MNTTTQPDTAAATGPTPPTSSAGVAPAAEVIGAKQHGGAASALVTVAYPAPWQTERPFGESGLYVAAANSAIVAKIYHGEDALGYQIAAVPAFSALALKLARLNRDADEIGDGMLAQLIDDAAAALKRARIPIFEGAEKPKRWEEMTREEKDADTRAKIDAMPPGFRGLYRVVLFCRENQACSTALRLRAYLCSLYNGSAARKVDLSDVQCFDGAIRRNFCEVLSHIGSHTSGLYDHHIREAFEKLGAKHYFDAGFPRRRG